MKNNKFAIALIVILSIIVILLTGGMIYLLTGGSNIPFNFNFTEKSMTLVDSYATEVVNVNKINLNLNSTDVEIIESAIEKITVEYFSNRDKNAKIEYNNGTIIVDEEKYDTSCIGICNTRRKIVVSVPSTYKTNYEIIEEGLNSRTFFSEDHRPGKEGKSGFNYLKPCLETHDKFDILVLMLGTNELKSAYNNSPDEILQMLDKFVKFIQNFHSQIDGEIPKLIISGIPPLPKCEENSNPNDKYYGAPEKCEVLLKLYKNYCLNNNLLYIDNSDLKVGIDCLHLTKNSHKILADKLYNLIKTL